MATKPCKNPLKQLLQSSNYHPWFISKRKIFWTSPTGLMLSYSRLWLLTFTTGVRLAHGKCQLTQLYSPPKGHTWRALAAQVANAASVTLWACAMGVMVWQKTGSSVEKAKNNYQFHGYYLRTRNFSLNQHFHRPSGEYVVFVSSINLWYYYYFWAQEVRTRFRRASLYLSTDKYEYLCELA